jgi:hypothetical protein
MYKVIFVMLFMSLLRLNAQNDTVFLVKAEKTVPLVSGTSVRITTAEEKIRGKISYLIKGNELFFVAGKDTINSNEVKEIKVFYKGSRIGGTVVTGIGGAGALYGIAIIVAASTELNEPGSWAGLGMVIGGMFTVASSAVSGVGMLVRSIGKKYPVPEWEIKY